MPRKVVDLLACWQGLLGDIAQSGLEVHSSLRKGELDEVEDSRPFSIEERGRREHLIIGLEKVILM